MSLILDGTNGLSDVDGTAAAPAIRGTDANTGIFFPAADTIGFAEGGAEAMRIDSSGNVGIGTSSGSARLNVNGGTSTSQIRWEVNNAAFTQEVSTNAAANAYVYKSNDASYHVWKLSSTEAMVLNASGNVGIGTSSPTTALTLGTSQTATVQNGGSNSAPAYAITSGALGINGITAPAANTLAFVTGSGERVRIDSSGNLLVGQTTAAVETGSIVTAKNLEITRTIDSDGGALGQLSWVNNTNAGVASGTSFAKDVACIKGLMDGTGNNSGGYLTFETKADAGTRAERMRIDGSGNVGIGTTSPGSQKVHIRATSPSEVMVRAVSVSPTGNGIYGQYNAKYDGTASDWYFGQDSGANLCFWNNTGSVSERMRIEPGGVVRINNTSDATFAAQLNTQFTNAKNCGIYLKVTNTSVTQSMIIFGNTAGNGVGDISTNGSSTAYNTSSDYRLKQDITPMTGALAKVALLKPVTYKWKFDGSDGEGFIAHELAEVCPHAVTGEKDAVRTVEIQDEAGNVTGTEERPIHQGIDTSFLVATLTAAIQELKAIVDTQAARITALEAA